MFVKILLKNELRKKAIKNARVAKEAEQRKNDLIVYLAHDLKTPLTSVIGYLTLLSEEPDIPAKTRAKYVGITLRKAERLEELINEFFDITRFNLSKIEIDLEKTNLSRMIEQVCNEFIPVLMQKGLTWNLAITPDIFIMCDTDKILRVFDNLIRNAINYSYNDTEIKCSLTLEDNVVYFLSLIHI